jgi:hypothetical protein
MWMRGDGAVVAGHGGPGVWVNGAQVLPPSAGNDPAWLGQSILCNDEHSQLVSIDEHGGSRTLIDARGASRVATDQNAPESPQWAAWLADGVTGLYTSWGLSVPAGELYGLSGGAVLGRPIFQAPGGLCAWAVGETNATRLLWQEPNAVVIEFSALSANECVWTDGARHLRVHGLPQPAQSAPYCFAPKVFRAGGALYLCEWRDGIGLVLRPWADADHGWVLFPGEAFGACGQVRDGQIDLAWAGNIAEQGPVYRASVLLNSPMQPLTPAPPEPIPPDPEPPKPEPPDPIPPDPEPIPPQPEPPKERTVQISLESIQPFEAPEVCTEVPHPDGQGLVALKTAAGLYKSLTPQGTWDEDKPSAGAWERFQPYGGVYLHYDGDSGVIYSVAVITITVAYQPAGGKSAALAAPAKSKRVAKPAAPAMKPTHTPPLAKARR